MTFNSFLLNSDGEEFFVLKSLKGVEATHVYMNLS